MTYHLLFMCSFVPSVALNYDKPANIHKKVLDLNFTTFFLTLKIHTMFDRVLRPKYMMGDPPPGCTMIFWL